MASDRICNEFIHQFQSQLASAESYHIGDWLREHLPYLVGPSITTFSPIAGAPGTVITVRGHRFGNAPEENTVQVGGRLARVIAASTTELKVVTSHDVMDGPVTVTVAGRVANGPVNFDVTSASDALAGNQAGSVRRQIAPVRALDRAPAAFERRCRLQLRPARGPNLAALGRQGRAARMAGACLPAAMGRTGSPGFSLATR